MKYDICVFGGCSLDAVYLQNKNLSYNEKPNSIFFGGKGANQAVASARAGAKVVMLTRLGNDEIGQNIIKNLKNNKIETKFIELEDGLQNDYSKVYVAYANGANNIVRETGAIASFIPSLVEKYSEVLLDSNVIVAQMKAPKEFSIELINFCHKNNKILIITPCRPDKLNINDKSNLELLDKITYLTMNEEECEKIFNTKDIDSCLVKYPNKLIVTLGIEGIKYHDGEKIITVPAIKSIIAKDSTGAGDTFCGNFAKFISSGMNLFDAIHKAQFASQIQIQKDGAQTAMPYLEDLEKYIEDFYSSQANKD